MSSPVLTPESWYHELGTKYVNAQILFHFNCTGVIADLAEHGPATSREIAQRLNLDGRILETLLNYVANTDAVLSIDAAGRYGFTEFGRKVLARYSRKEKDGTIYNFHEVRVGALGPVWSELSGLLQGRLTYGKEVRRRGEYAEDGVYAQARKFSPSLLSALRQLRPARVIEIGANTGITEQVGAEFPEAAPACLDRSPEALARARTRYDARVPNHPAEWIQADYFQPESWLTPERAADKLVLFSIHFHEVLAAGEAAFVESIRKIRATGAKGWVIALEQPRLPESARSETPGPLWLYNHSNVLIHHLIGNGRIFAAEEWVELFERAGSRHVRTEPTGFLGYQLFLFEL